MESVTAVAPTRDPVESASKPMRIVLIYAQAGRSNADTPHIAPIHGTRAAPDHARAVSQAHSIAEHAPRSAWIDAMHRTCVGSTTILRASRLIAWQGRGLGRRGVSRLSVAMADGAGGKPGHLKPQFVNLFYPSHKVRMMIFNRRAS